MMTLHDTEAILAVIAMVAVLLTLLTILNYRIRVGKDEFFKRKVHNRTEGDYHLWVNHDNEDHYLGIHGKSETSQVNVMLSQYQELHHLPDTFKTDVTKLRYERDY